MENTNLPGFSGSATPDSASRISALDLYEDLLIGEDKYDENRMYTLHEIMEEKRLLEEQSASLLNQVVESKLEMKKLEAENATLRRSYDSLLATARAELNRKNELIRRHINSRAKPFHESSRKVVHPKTTSSTSVVKKKNLIQLYKGKRVPEDELESARSASFNESNRSASWKSVSSNTSTESTVSMSSVLKPVSAPEHLVSRKRVEDMPLSIPTTSSGNSAQRHPQVRERHQTRSSALNEQSETKYCHTEKIDTPMRHERNRADFNSAKSNLARNNDADLNTKPARSGQTMNSLNAKSSSNQRRNFNSRSMTPKDVRTDLWKSRSHEPDTISKIFSFSQSHVTTASHISGSLIQRPQSPKQPHSACDVRVKETGRSSRSTGTESDSKIVSRNLGQRSNKHQKSKKSRRKTISEVGEQFGNRPVSQTKELRDTSHHTTSRPSSVPLQNRHISESHIDGPIGPSNEINIPSAASPLKDSDPISHRVKIGEIANSKHSSKSAFTRKSSVVHVEAENFHGTSTGNGKHFKKVRKDHGPDQLVHLHATTQNDKKSPATLLTVEDPTYSPKSPTAEFACDPFDNTHSTSLVNDSPSVRLKSASSGHTTCSTIKEQTSRSNISERESNCDERGKHGLRTQSKTSHDEKSTLTPLPGSACVGNGLKLVIKTRRPGENAVSLSAEEIPADFQPRVCLVDIKSMDSPLKERSKEILEPGEISWLATVSRKRKLIQKENDEDSKKQKRSKLFKTNGLDTRTTSLSSNFEAICQTRDSTISAQPSLQTATPESGEVCKLLQVQSPHEDIANLSSDSDTKPQKSRIFNEDCVASPLKGLKKTNVTHDEPKVISIPHQEKHGRVRPISTSIYSSDTTGEEKLTRDLPKAIFTPCHEKHGDDTSFSISTCLTEKVKSTHCQDQSKAIASPCHQNRRRIQPISTITDSPEATGLLKATRNKPKTILSPCHKNRRRVELISTNLHLPEAIGLPKVTTDQPRAISRSYHDNYESVTSISTSTSRRHLTPTSLPKTPTATSSLNAWLASGQIGRQNCDRKSYPVKTPPISSHKVDNDLKYPKRNYEESISEQIQRDESKKSKNFRNAALRWLLCLAAEELKATEGLAQNLRQLPGNNGSKNTKITESGEETKTPASRKVWLSSLTRCQERRRQNSKWSS